MTRNANVPVGARGAATEAPVGAQATVVATETPVGAQETAAIVPLSESLLAALKAASDSIKGQTVGTLEEALQSDVIKGRGDYFDPSLSQYKENLVLYFDPKETKVKISDIGRNGSVVATVPAATFVPNRELIFDKVFNVYISTLRKSITRYNEIGEPELDENNNPIIIDGHNNAFWTKCSEYKNDLDLLAFISGKKIKTNKIMRDFGPSGFVKIPGSDSMKPTGHKLTSLPLFEEI